MQNGPMINAPSQGLKLRTGLLIYAICLVVTFAIPLAAKSYFDTSAITVYGYLISGVVLNRVVLRRMVTWHPNRDTLANVTKAKLMSFLFWPLSYFFLFSSLIVGKIL